jgi:hypothetical protein
MRRDDEDMIMIEMIHESIRRSIAAYCPSPLLMHAKQLGAVYKQNCALLAAKDILALPSSSSTMPTFHPLGVASE